MSLLSNWSIYKIRCFQGCEKDLKDSYAYSLLSCNLGNPRSCYNAGSIEINGMHGAEKNSERAIGLLERACDRKIGDSCLSLFDVYLNGKKYGLESNPDKALSAAIRTCDMEYLPGCVNASIMYKRGDGIPKDIHMSKVFEEKAQSIVQKAKRPAVGVSFGEMHKKV
jgi:TPR repeat protein